MAAAEYAYALGPEDPDTLDLLGQVFSQVRHFERAADAYRAACRLAPDRAACHYNLATVFIALGDTDAAEQAVTTCLQCDPCFWRAHLTRAHLKQHDAASNHVAPLASLLERHGNDPLARICLNLALAKEYEDLGRYANAFRHLVLGKTASREEITYESGQDTRLIDAMIRAFPGPIVIERTHDARSPIFILGMPRTGTTLVERILASHPEVRSIGEPQAFGMAVGQAWGTRPTFAGAVDPTPHMNTLDWQLIGDRYLAMTGQNADGGRFIDKFPQNFLYAGFIAHAFPHAKLICLRRHPLDTCLSNFRELFAEKLPYYHYSFDLMDIGRYYVGFDRLMSHWQRVLPGRILEVRYESLVAEPELVVRQLLDHCSLPWDANCLAFERNETPVATASALQVRQPLYHEAVGRWRRYEAELAPLSALLRQSGVDIPS
nr:sulfotransferase [Dyella sp. A6]